MDDSGLGDIIEYCCPECDHEIRDPLALEELPDDEDDDDNEDSEDEQMSASAPIMRYAYIDPFRRPNPFNPVSQAPEDENDPISIRRIIPRDETMDNRFHWEEGKNVLVCPKCKRRCQHEDNERTIVCPVCDIELTIKQ